MNIQAVRTAPRSPWQNGYVERVIGSISVTHASGAGSGRSQEQQRTLENRRQRLRDLLRRATRAT